MSQHVIEINWPMTFSFERLLVTDIVLHTLGVCWSRSCCSSEILDTDSINKIASNSLVYILSLTRYVTYVKRSAVTNQIEI